MGNDPHSFASYIPRMYELLDGYFGNLHWWPADTPFEVIVGAILTQNTAWRNVVSALLKLKEAGLLTPEGLDGADTDTLASLIRSSGYFRVKSRRLKAFVEFLRKDHGGRLDNLFDGEIGEIRKKLLQINGVGEETADSILLYAGGKPVFVIDAYTRRILARHGIIDVKAKYAEIQKLFMDNLPLSAPLYNQYHALLVNAGKIFCARDRRCRDCPLQELTPRTLS